MLCVSSSKISKRIKIQGQGLGFFLGFCAFFGVTTEFIVKREDKKKKKMGVWEGGWIFFGYLQCRRERKRKGRQGLSKLSVGQLSKVAFGGVCFDRNGLPSGPHITLSKIFISYDLSLSLSLTHLLFFFYQEKVTLATFVKPTRKRPFRQKMLIFITFFFLVEFNPHFQC